ncbi:MAG: N-acetylneuraminate synthase family protein [Oscillospiraceae bacterium]
MIKHLKNVFPNIKIGYSDHTMPDKTMTILTTAYLFGAEVIEKHFTLDKTMEGPDHKASLEPKELAEMVKAIRHTEEMLGDGKKAVSDSEAKNKPIARKSIVAAKNISEGEEFTSDNITVKRPGDGVSPMRWHEVLGQKAKRGFIADEKIEL